MKLPSIPVLDAASYIAIGTAILYLLGVANIQGDAVVLGVPSSLILRDFRDVIALGADSLLLLVVLIPQVVFVNGSIVWTIPTVLIGSAGTGFILYRLSRASSWSVVIMTLWLLATLYLLINVTSAIVLAKRLTYINSSLAHENKCDRSPAKRVVYFVSPEKPDERVGCLLFMSSDYFVLYTTNGVVAIPRAVVRTIEAVRTH